MKRFLTLALVGCTLLATSCKKDPTPVEEDERVTLTTVTATYGDENLGTETADYVLLKLREGSFNSEGVSTGKGTELTIACFTEHSATVRQLSTGDYTVSGNVVDPAIKTFIPGAGTGAADEGTYVTKYDGQGGNETTYFLGGKFNVAKSGDTYTLTIDLRDVNNAVFEAKYSGTISFGGVTPPDNFTTVEYAAAGYFGDYYNSETANWLIDLYNGTADGYTGIYIDLNMAPSFTYANGELEQTTYTFNTTPDRGSYMPGVTETEQGEQYPVGTFGYVMDDDENILSATLVTGGTITIAKSGTNYTITTDLTTKDWLTDQPAEKIRIQFEGEVSLYDESEGGEGGDWPGLEDDLIITNTLTMANREIIQNGNSTTWFMYLAENEDDSQPSMDFRIFISSTTATDGRIPQGTYNMASTAGIYAAGTAEPGNYDEELGCVFMDWSGSAYTNKVNAAPGKGKIEISYPTAETVSISLELYDTNNHKITATATGPAELTYETEIEALAVYYYGDTGNNSDRWRIYAEGPLDFFFFESYLVEFYTATGNGTSIPTGEFNMAAAAGANAAGTMEPGGTDNNSGTWWQDNSIFGVMDELPAFPGTGSLVIGNASGGNSVAFDFMTETGAYNGSYSGPVEIIDDRPEGVHIMSWASGLTRYAGTEYSENAHNFHTSFLGEGLSWDEDGRPQGTGHWVKLDFFSPTTAVTNIGPGNYTVNRSNDPFTIDPDYSLYTQVVDGVQQGFYLVSGTATVAYESGIYTISFDVTTTNGSKITGTYVGEIEYIDDTQTSSLPMSYTAPARNQASAWSPRLYEQKKRELMGTRQPRNAATRIRPSSDGKATDLFPTNVKNSPAAVRQSKRVSKTVR